MCQKFKLSKREAKSALSQNRNHGHTRNRPWRKEVREYYCPDCGYHHLTSMEEYVIPEEIKSKYKKKWKRLLK